MPQSAKRRGWKILALCLLLESIHAAGGDLFPPRAVAQDRGQATTARPHADPRSAGPVAQLGDLSFPTSGTQRVQPKFLIGVKLLHNFEYEEAKSVFQDCQHVDPQFAMAYWGEAMCLNHPLHLEQDLDAGRAVLRRLDDVRAGPMTERERGFIDSVRILFGEGDKQQRDQRYLAALAELSERYPADHEVTCFYALAVLGSSAGNRDTHVYMRAAGLLEDVYLENPRHPGVLHYLIHCYDDPVHAPLGLRAARTYGTIAGNSAHALHMPAHIYLPLGKWDEMISANEAAWQAGVQRLERLRLGDGEHDIHALHALQWLHYGYLQKGEYQRAFKQLETMAEIHRRKPTPMSKWYFALMRAAYIVDAADWRKANMEMDMEGVELSATASDLFARGLAAIRRNTTGGERAMKRIATVRADAEHNIEDSSRHHTSYFDGVFASSIRAARIMETQLEALILLADGHQERAVERMKDAVAAEERMPFGYGPPLPVKSSQELLGEILLNLGLFDEAIDSFEQSLRRTPRRIASLMGLRAAARATRDATRIAVAEKKLRTIRPDQRSVYRGWRELPFARD